MRFTQKIKLMFHKKGHNKMQQEEKKADSRNDTTLHLIAQ